MDIPDAKGTQANYRLLSRERDMLEEKTEEELARSIEDRYRQISRRGGMDDDGAAEAGTVGQQGLLPTINDPKLWMVHCRPGRAREACTQLLQKCYTMHGTPTPLLIKSAIALDHLKVMRWRCMEHRNTCVHGGDMDAWGYECVGVTLEQVHGDMGAWGLSLVGGSRCMGHGTWGSWMQHGHVGHTQLYARACKERSAITAPRMHERMGAGIGIYAFPPFGSWWGGNAEECRLSMSPSS